jgi:hypothetical protein
MATHPHSDLREEIYQYLQGCEHLLSAASSPQPFTEEEVMIIQYYQDEIGKIRAVSTTP